MTITGAKMEEEVPRTLGYLGYPFTVAKSCLKSVGSPHAWPILVGVLTWLIEVSVFSQNGVYVRYVRISLFYVHMYTCICLHLYEI